MTSSYEVALVDTELIELLEGGALRFPADRYQLPRLRSYVQPASVDIPVSGSVFLVKEKVLPFSQKVSDLLPDLVLEEKSLKGDGVVLLRGQTYLVHCGQLALPEGHRGALSPKSSVGRIDLMVRGIVDGCGLYDTVLGGRPGNLWLEVAPQSFNVRVREGLALTQLMVFREDASVASIDLSAEQIVFDASGEPVEPLLHRGALVMSLSVANVMVEAPSEDLQSSVLDKSSCPSKDLQSGAPDVLSYPSKDLQSSVLEEAPCESPRRCAAAGSPSPPDSLPIVGYEAIATNDVIDLSRIGAHRAEDFFRPIHANARKGRLTLEKDRFYILCAKEYVSVPIHLSAEMVPFSNLVGEFRAHYAGFFDPGFGYGKDGETRGSAGVLEVRPHQTITVYDGQPICMMEFYRNASTPAEPYGFSGNNYMNQKGPKLAKYFS